MSDEVTITKEDFRRIGYEVIPRAQYEALMAEHHAIQRYLAGDTSCNGGAEIMFEKVYEQARAAGIRTGDRPND